MNKYKLKAALFTSNRLNNIKQYDQLSPLASGFVYWQNG
jgi:hypothetical protein